MISDDKFYANILFLGQSAPLIAHLSKSCAIRRIYKRGEKIAKSDAERTRRESRSADCSDFQNRKWQKSDYIHNSKSVERSRAFS